MCELNFLSMNVKCPYCGCGYDIGADILKNPIGSEKLGYGWWLRCYRCKRKWWLKNTSVEIAMNTPIKVDKLKQIQRISSLSKKKTTFVKRYSFKIWMCIIWLSIIGGCVIGYQYRSVFYKFLVEKARRLSENVAGKITMTDVKYELMADNTVTVTGNILNYDERAITKVNGVRVSVFDGQSLIMTWNNDFDDLRILPQQKIPFSASKQLPKDITNIRVEVSIF